MNKILTFMKKTANSCGVKVKKYSPEILLTVGLISGGAAIFIACKETIKAGKIVKTHKETMNQIDTAEVEGGELEDGTEYTPEVAKHDRYVAKVHTGVALVRNYAPSAGLVVLSTACILASFRIIKKRYVAAVATAEFFKTAYDQLYSRVEKKYGKDEAEALASGKETMTIVDKNTGEEKEIIISNPNDIYSIYFCPSTSMYWENEQPEYMRAMLNRCQEDTNNTLKIDGHVFLSKPFEELGIKIPKKKENGMTMAAIASQVGWLYNNTKAKKAGVKCDEFVDFHIEEIHRDDIAFAIDKKYENGEDISELSYIYDLFQNHETGKRESTIWKLTFNVDGPIWRYI